MIEIHFMRILQEYIKEKTRNCIEERISPGVYGHLLPEACPPYIQCAMEDSCVCWEGSVRSKILIQFSLFQVSAYLGLQELLQMRETTRRALDGKKLDLPEAYAATLRYKKDEGNISHKKDLYTAKDSYEAFVRKFN